MKRLLIALVAAGLLSGRALPVLAQIVYTPAVVTGFTADVVADGSGPAASVTTAPFDQGSATQDSYCLVALGYVSPTAGPATRGLPVGGLLQNLASAAPTLTFQLQHYAAANSLRIAGTGTGSLTLATPRPAQSVWVAASTGNGDPSGIKVVNRWGRRVYEGHRATEGWDPTTHSAGTYYYLADYTDCPGRPQSHKTWVEVMK